MPEGKRLECLRALLESPRPSTPPLDDLAAVLEIAEGWEEVEVARCGREPLGIGVQQVDSKFYLHSVRAKTPAYWAGLGPRAGRRVAEINGEEPTCSHHLTSLIGEKRLVSIVFGPDTDKCEASDVRHVSWR
eukprot:TRINITY_DN27881_c0_g1_i1.p1 TRINITY_DN27881_c0_g1~~TRINITY_DN27881_c0_g1_i1.p1  ORF type:complete len:132 (+),score=23.80 TRINITY_DN27881_c0_g1_i1:79-474(+)